MRIAYFVDQFPSVSETFVIDQITGLRDLGHDVDIYASRPQEQGEIPAEFLAYGLGKHTRYFPQLPQGAGTRVMEAVRLALAHPRSLPILARTLSPATFGRYARSLRLAFWSEPFLGAPARYDAIHAHFGPNGIRANLLRRLGVLGGPLVTTFHGYDMTRYVARHGAGIYSGLFRDGQLFLPVSERWQKKLIAMGCPKDRTLVHRMGIDTGRFEFRERIHQGETPVRFISVARLVEKKGIEYAIRALARMEHADAEYDIVGDGPLRETLQELANGLGLRSRVRFLGWRSKGEVGELLAGADALLAPSVTSADGDQEGIPVVLMEAMASGLPVISTRHSGIPELVEHDRSGVLAEERDVEMLSSLMARVAGSEELRISLARAARERVVAEFDRVGLNERLEKLLERASTGAAPEPALATGTF